MVIFGVFALIAHFKFKEDDSGLIKGGFKDAASYYLFFLWNSFMWSVILLCPSVTTDKREKVIKCPVALFYLIIFLVPPFVLLEWVLDILTPTIRFEPDADKIPNVSNDLGDHFFVSPLHGILQPFVCISGGMV